MSFSAHGDNNNKLGGNGGEFIPLYHSPWMSGRHEMNLDLDESKRGCSSSRHVCDGPQCQENNTERTLQNYVDLLVENGGMKWKGKMIGQM
jgi:hypothetical protein